MRRRRASLVAAAVLGVALLGATVGEALAEPGPIQLVSSNGIEQADSAEEPALSADGRFVAFIASIGGEAGVFRKNLVTGELATVYGTDPSAFEAGYEPAISADGRYVSFTTPEPLDPDDDTQPHTSDVYVADMATTPPTYELASTVTGHCEPLATTSPHTPCGLTYEGNAGAVATGRVSLSASGRELVFVTRAASNLTEPAVTSGTLPTPALQVAVRNLETDETTLISSALDPVTGQPEPDTPVEGGAVAATVGIRLPPGASISGDGSTVAWLGRHLRAQVQLPAPEAEEIALHEDGAEGYDEPLWRRVPGPADQLPPTRRIVNGLLFPAMVSGANAEGRAEACRSAFGWNLGAGQAVPVLSSDGDRVALVGQPDGYANAFVAETAGPSAGTVRRLTETSPLPLGDPCQEGDQAFAAVAAEIKAIAISPVGDRIAFTTQRQRFQLSPPNLVTPPPTSVGAEELYLLDLGTLTLERLTHGATLSEPSRKEEPNQPGTNSVSFDGSGETLAFASGAYNLVPADGNGFGNGAAGALGTDVFVVSDPRSTSSAGTTRISRPPAAIRPQARWELTARVSSRPDGSVRVAVGVPGAGRLGAAARTIPAKGSSARKVAAARRHAQLASVLVFVLHPAPGLLGRVRAPGGLETTLRLRFAGTGGKPLTDILSVRFRCHRGGKHKKDHAK